MTSSSNVAHASHVAITQVYKHDHIPRSVRTQQLAGCLNLIPLTKQPLRLRSERRKNINNVTLPSSKSPIDPKKERKEKYLRTLSHAPTRTPFLTRTH
ncbi:hypothetical protein RJT34_26962 [Clitoria ternatea]|uniref:Uncharacterized protein n=1 Tax=Clitoria ternatea TaxID=43366 RepID=A0AAN9F7E2_CLITE